MTKFSSFFLGIDGNAFASDIGVAIVVYSGLDRVDEGQMGLWGLVRLPDGLHSLHPLHPAKKLWEILLLGLLGKFYGEDIVCEYYITSRKYSIRVEGFQLLYRQFCSL